MRTIVSLLLVSLVLSQGFLAPQQEVTRDQILAFMNGFLYAVGVLPNAPDLGQCYYEVKFVPFWVGLAVEMFEQAKTKEERIQVIRQVVEGLYTGALPCVALIKELDVEYKFVKDFFTIGFPQNAIDNLSKNWSTVVFYVGQMIIVNEWDDKGLCAGEIIHIMLTGRAWIE